MKILSNAPLENWRFEGRDCTFLAICVNDAHWRYNITSERSEKTLNGLFTSGSTVTQRSKNSLSKVRFEIELDGAADVDLFNRQILGSTEKVLEALGNAPNMRKQADHFYAAIREGKAKLREKFGLKEIPIESLKELERDVNCHSFVGTEIKIVVERYSSSKILDTEKCYESKGNGYFVARKTIFSYIIPKRIADRASMWEDDTTFINIVKAIMASDPIKPETSGLVLTRTKDNRLTFKPAESKFKKAEKETFEYQASAKEVECSSDLGDFTSDQLDQIHRIIGVCSPPDNLTIRENYTYSKPEFKMELQDVKRQFKELGAIEVRILCAKANADPEFIRCILSKLWPNEFGEDSSSEGPEN